MNTEKIKELNDKLRKYFIGGKVIITQGIRAMPDEDKEILFTKVKNFNDFNQGNNPYGENDFGCINFKGEQFFWKIDYYDVDYLGLSVDASDETVTNRVLTIMKAEEY